MLQLIDNDCIENLTAVLFGLINRTAPVSAADDPCRSRGCFSSCLWDDVCFHRKRTPLVLSGITLIIIQHAVFRIIEDQREVLGGTCEKSFVRVLVMNRVGVSVVIIPYTFADLWDAA